MIYIDDVIELKTYKNDEYVILATKYLVQTSFTFTLKVSSGGFYGNSSFCIRKDQLQNVCNNLKSMYSNLEGFTRINDNDSDAYVLMQIKRNGHLTIEGQVGGSYQDHFMNFKFQTDQTCIPSLIKDFESLSNYI